MRILFLVVLMGLGSSAYAQVSLDGVNLTPRNRSQVSGGLALSDIEYEVDGEDVDAKRTILHDFHRVVGVAAR